MPDSGKPVSPPGMHTGGGLWDHRYNAGYTSAPYDEFVNGVYEGHYTAILPGLIDIMKNTGYYDIREWRELMKKIVLFVITFWSMTLTLIAENINIPIAVEIINIPQEYNNKICIAGIAGQNNGTPRVHHRIFGDIFAGELKYKDGRLWKIDDAERNIRYQIILVINNSEENSSEENNSEENGRMITKYSRRFLIESDVIKLDYNTDFFDSAMESLNHYTPVKNRLPRNRLWALALTGFLTIANNDQHDLLGFDDINENSRNKYLELLRRDWSVNNREELLETIQKTESDGHAAALRSIKQIIQETLNEQSEFSIITVYNKYHLSSRYYNYLKFTVINWNRFSNRTILAWDLGRAIALCRWGYSAGFLTEEESWGKTMALAGRIQAIYQSWEEFGYDYYMGRVFWASGFGDDINYLVQTDNLYKNLTGENGYWRNFEWRLDLSE
ncbi:MAG: DUF1266 domain-containing protein [Treponema sp.]|jgi:hypothetical protein|nr:DUF1266 domain-containing protein [Treponema sp.]